MKPKQMLKSIIGAERLSNLKGNVYHYGCKIRMLINRTPSVKVSSEIKIKRILSDDNYHVYRGYYDLNYLNNDGDKFLCHRLPIKAKNNKETSCEIGYYNLENEQFYKIDDTQAWCWQQGSRLRWHPTNEDCILVNSVENNKYCTKIYEINEKKIVDIIDKPIYDLTSDFRYGLSINFSRLQRLRPGYGYDYLQDETEGNNAPKDDGIFLVNLKNKQNRLIYSLEELAKKIEESQKFEHYVNHISIAPDGNNFIFFHIYTKKNSKDWRTILYVSDIQGKTLKCLEKEDRVSHYCWIDSEKIMVTCMRNDGSHYYSIYNIKTKEKRIIKDNLLINDGHPNKISKDRYITDTYPLNYSLQKLLLFSTDNKNTKILATIYHDYRLRGEKRCDLHPVFSKKGNYISVDSTFKNKRRSIIIFEFNKEKEDE